MAKAHRGTGIRELVSHGRGECPICKKTGIKVLYEVEKDGQKIKVCKFCNAHMKNEARKAAKIAAKAAREAAPAESSATEETASAEA